jgi:hypothetical protein
MARWTRLALVVDSIVYMFLPIIYAVIIRFFQARTASSH